MFNRVADLASQHGISLLGGLHPDREKTVLMLGYGGPEMWQVFAKSVEYSDGSDDPMDRWSERVITNIANELGATAYFPFGGPPYHPFIQWAKQAEPLWSSPIGMSIHAERGLWSSWRGALGFDQRIELPKTPDNEQPCISCSDQSCLSACPVDAFEGGNYDTAACAAYLQTDAGQDCLGNGCLARRACPVGQRFAHIPDQATFHMGRFLKARLAAQSETV